MLSVLGILVTASVLCVILLSYKSEIAVAVVLSAGCIALLWAMGTALPIVSELRSKFESFGIETGSYSVALKSLGICYATRFTSDLCRDMGQTALASKAELVGKCTVFVLCAPLIISIAESALELLK